MNILEITTKIGCKNACIYCPQDKLMKAYRKRSNLLEMSFDVFKKCIDKVPSNVQICFCGMSEPWLNPECTKMMLYAYKKEHDISVNTTLVGMKLRDADLFTSIPFEYFNVHLPSKEHYEQIDVDEHYLKILKKISKSNIKVSFILQSGMLHPKVQSLIKKEIYPQGLFTRAGNIKIKHIPLPKRKRGVMWCFQNLSRHILLPNGDVGLCCMDYGLKHILGNLLSSDYDSLFQSKEFRKIKKGLLDESLDILCRYCQNALHISLCDWLSYAGTLKMH